MMKPLPITPTALHTVIAILSTSAAVCHAASVNLLATETATSFSHYFEGNEIYDSADTGSEWKNGFAAGGAGSNVTLTTNGTDLNFSSTAGGASWIEGVNSNNGTDSWATGVLGEGDAHTWEIRLRLNDNDANDNAFAVWTGHTDGLDIYLFTETELRITQVGGGFTTVAHDFTEFTTVRFAYDGSTDNFFEIVHVWIDGVQVTQDNGNPRTSGSNDNRLIIGDTTSGQAGDHLDIDIDYFAYDVDNAYAPVPVPESSSSALIGFGVLSFSLRRKR